MVFTASFLENGLTNKFVFTNSSEVKVGIDLLEDEIRGPTGSNEVVVFESTKYTVDDPEYREAVETLTANIAALGGDVIRLHTLGNFYSLGGSFLVSENKGSTLIAFVMAGDFDHNSDNIDAVVDVVRDSAEAYEGEFVIKITGQSTIGLDNRKLSQEDLEKGESLGVPTALIILIIVLGAVAAALVPLVIRTRPSGRPVAPEEVVNEGSRNVSTVARPARGAPSGERRETENGRTMPSTASRADVARCSFSRLLPLPATGMGLALCHSSAINDPP